MVAHTQRNRVLSGASGATPSVKRADLTEEQKQTISSLSTLAAGLASGLTGDSSANAVAGAQAGKNAAENNLLGGNEDTQTRFVQDHGKDIASCSTNPSGAACQSGLTVNDAMAAALGAGAAGGTIAALTPAAVEAGVRACTANPVLCANEMAIRLTEMGMGDALPAGLTIGATGKITAEQLTLLTEMKTAQEIEKQTGKVSTNTVEQLIRNNEAHNAANYLSLKMDLKTTQAANEAIESLRATGQLPANYLDKTQAISNG